VQALAQDASIGELAPFGAVPAAVEIHRRRRLRGWRPRVSAAQPLLHWRSGLLAGHTGR
jgi:hypothetical protein